MKRINHFLRNYFGFSQRETKGFIFLCILMLSSLSIPFLSDHCYQPDHAFVVEDKRLMDSLRRFMEKDKSYPRKSPVLSNVAAPSFAGRPFNPNIADELQLEGLFGKRIAKTILNFRSKGGVFRVKSDLKKIYGLSEALYQQAVPYIDLPMGGEHKDGLEKKISVSSGTMPLDINQADTSDLIRLKGIGKVLGARILKYRSRLGGFVSSDQYKEVYGLDSLVLHELNSKAFIRSGYVPRKLAINTASAEELAAHPYLGYRYAKVLCQYRSNHGRYDNIHDLYKVKAIPEETLKKLEPYLDFQ